jgi:4-carboxymuconolactone decarboxylase
MNTRLVWISLGLLMCSATGALAQRVPEARVSPLPVSEWTAQDREILGRMARGEQTIDVFKTCLKHTELCRAWMPFTQYLLSATSTLTPRDKEIAILRIAALCKADYDWGHHVPAAERAGLSADDIARIAKGPDAPGWNEWDRTVLRAVDELHRDAHIQDATWKALSQRFSQKQLMDFVFTVGQYNLVSMFANSAGIQLEAGVPKVPR